MRRVGVVLAACALAMPVAVTAQWQFGDPVNVSPQTTQSHYHHLDGSARRHVAASAEQVAVVWEDDRSGSPQVYLATKRHEESTFREQRLSDGGEAYEPAVVVLPGERWLAAWEQDGGIKARVFDAAGAGPVATLLEQGGRQVSLAADDAGRVSAVWARSQRGGQQIEAIDLVIEENRIVTPAPASAVAPLEDRPYQGYPAAAFTAQGRLLVAWEDRRAGHTRLFHSWRDPGRSFAPARQLNEHFAPADTEQGLGTGVMRVTIAVGADGEARAIWLDKRNAASGYAVWGASSGDGGLTFGPNRIVQDDMGAAVAQWHAALSGGDSGFVAAWNDARESWANPDETGDVILSWTVDGSWSPDLVVPGASGDGYQGSPALTLDPTGGLHLVWITRPDLTAPTALRYLRALPGR